MGIKKGKLVKVKHRIKLIEYIGNPNNDFPSRTEMSIDVLGFKQQHKIYQYFTLAELTDIEREGLDLRRSKYLKHSADIDVAMVEKAKSGDVAGMKLFYQRVENWSETQVREFKGKLGVTVDPWDEVIKAATKDNTDELPNAKK